jgi:uncharacterized protein YbaR (Trm112 family)
VQSVSLQKEEAAMTKQLNHKLLLHACPRCRGDLFPDFEDDELLACLQCGRRYPQAQLTVAAAAQPQLAPAA